MAGDADLQQRLRGLPAVDRVMTSLAASAPHAERQAAARRAIDDAREQVRAGAPAPSLEEITAGAERFLDARKKSHLQPVINATGVLLHTNLGRAPLGEEQLAAVRAIATGYSNLEYGIEEGQRGSRYTHATRSISALTGAESALVVNNNAAAVLLTLASLCSGKEVIISRGELVEIGGEFRIPDVMVASGTTLVEIGTTNRTHLADYEKAITPNTAAILKVHPSNYRVVGFTASVDARQLARLALARHICFIHDLGSGLVSDQPYVDEPLVAAALEDGADIVTFSGDKLLGGPQAGIVAGRGHLIEKISRHPMLRALRPDKMTLAALEATLQIYLEGRSSELPLWKMASAYREELQNRGDALVAKLGEELDAGFKLESVALAAVAGGGSLPGAELDSWGLSINHAERSTAELQRALRYVRPPVIGRVDDDRLLLDLRTVPPEQDALLLDLLRVALRSGTG